MALTRPLINNLNTNIEVFNDTITVLHANASVANSDIGLLMNRASGLVPNAAFYWNETTQSFVTALTSNTGVGYSNISITSYANVITGNLLPGANVTYNLGSPTQRWAELYISGNTIDLNGATISAVNGAMTLTNQMGGSFTVSGSVPGQSTGTFGNLVANSGVTSSNASSGALQVVGGAGITGALFVGTTISAGSVYAATIGNTGATLNGAFGTVTGSVPTANSAIYVGITAESTGTWYPTMSGQYLTPGGNVQLGIANAFNVNATTGNVTAPGFVGTLWGQAGITGGNISGVTAVSSTGNITVGGNLITTNGIYWAGNGSSYSSGGGGGSFNGGTITNALTISNSTTSTSNGTGALIVTGGAGIAGNLNAGATSGTLQNQLLSGTQSAPVSGYFLAGAHTVLSGAGGNYLAIGQNASSNFAQWLQSGYSNASSPVYYPIILNPLGGNVVVGSTTTSISSTTGALVVQGGAGITGNLYVGGNLVVAGTQTFSNTEIVNSTEYVSTINATNVYGVTVGNIGANHVGTGTYLTSLNASNLSSGTVPLTQLSGITTSQLSSSAGITNGQLANSSITVTAGTGLSGGGAVSLGSSVTLNNAGVTSAVAGTDITVSGATGAVTIGTNSTLATVTGRGATTSTAVTLSGGLTVGTSLVPSSNVAITLGSSTAWWSTVYGKAVQAQYADLAENYTADAVYAPGTVVVFGGNAEITVTTTSHDTTVAGIISTNPAYLMNGATPGLPVALTGRVPCLVQGPVKQGQVLVTSSTAGVAQAIDNSKFLPGCVIGKALEAINTNTIETIEVVVGRF